MFTELIWLCKILGYLLFLHSILAIINGKVKVLWAGDYKIRTVEKKDEPGVYYFLIVTYIFCSYGLISMFE